MSLSAQSRFSQESRHCRLSLRERRPFHGAKGNSPRRLRFRYESPSLGLALVVALACVQLASAQTTIPADTGKQLVGNSEYVQCANFADTKECICVCDAYAGGGGGAPPPGGGSPGPKIPGGAIANKQHGGGGLGGGGFGGGGGGGGGGTASGPVGNGDLCPILGEFQSQNMSFVGNATQNYHHIALDYAPGSPIGGCTSCGGGLPFGGSVLDSLFIERRHRYRDMTQVPSSFGPGVFCNYDVALTFYPQPNYYQQYTVPLYDVELFDPRELNPKVLSGQINQQTMQPNGVYVDSLNQWVKSFACYDANGNFVVDARQAATGVLTNWPGYKYTFEIFSVGGTADSPAAWYKFDEGSGTTAGDASGNGNTGTLVNNPTWTTGESGDGVQCASGYVSLGNPADLNIEGPITLAAWVNASQYQGNQQYEDVNGQYTMVWIPQTILRHGTSTSGTSVFLYAQNNQFTVGSTDSSGVNHTVSCGVQQQQSQWIHVAGVYDGANWVIYQNGVEAGSAPSTVGAVTSTGNWAIGADGSGTMGFFNGTLDGVQIYNRALNAAEVADLAQIAALAGRLKSITDRNGYATTLTYKTFTAQQIAASPHLQFQIDTVTDPYGRQASFSYSPDLQSGRWAVSQINFPNGHKAVYNYADGQLATVAFDDGTQSTFAYGTDATSKCSTVQYFDVATVGSHRAKTAYFTDQTVLFHTSADTNLIINQSSSIIRLLTNGSGEVAFLNMSPPGADPNNPNISYELRLNYEGAGRLKMCFRSQYSQFFLSGWTLGDPAQGYNAISGPHESVYAQCSDETNLLGTPQYLIDPQGHQFNYYYDGDTFVTTKQWSDDTGEEFTYNGFKQVTRYEDRDQNVTLNTYDAQGNLLSMEVGIKVVGGVDTPQPEYAKYQWTYYPAGDPNQFLMASAVDANGNSTQFFYDNNHKLVSVVEPPDAPGDAQATTTVSYDTASRVQQVLDPMNRAVVYAYDERDRVATITYGDSSTERFIYGAPGSGNENLLVRQKDRNGVTVRFDYDAAGRVSTTTFAYSMMDQADSETLITDPSVVVTKTCTYLDGTDLVSSCSERGETTTYGYDYRHRVVSTTVQPRVGVMLTSTRTYVNNLLFCETDPYGRSKYFGYRSSDGELIREIQGTVPSFALADFTAVMNETRSATPNAQFLITDYQLDNDGQQIGIVDGNNNTLAQTFDSRGQLVQRVEASGTAVAATRGFLYDADGNTIEQRSPRYYDSSDPQVGNCRIQMTYTGRNLLATKIEAPGTSVAGTVRYSYNLDGTEASKVDARNNTWQTLWSACCAGRKTADLDPTSAGRSIEYDYAGNVTFLQAVGGATAYNQVTTRYDARRRPTFRTVWLTTAPNVDPNNPPIAGQNGVPAASGLTTQWYYDENLADAIGLSNPAGESIAGIGNVSIAPLLSEVQADGITFGNGSDGYAALEIRPDGELVVTILDGAYRTVATGIIQPPSAQNPNQPITWSTRLDDTVVAVASPGNLLETATIDALNNTVRQRTDGARRLIQRVDAESNVTSMTFDANSNQLSAADPNSVGYTAVFDARNRETSRTDTMNATVQRTYDGNRNLVKWLDAKNNASTAIFDARDRRVSLTDRIGGTTSWSLDTNSNVLSITDSESRVTSFNYSLINKPLTETYADSNPPTVNDQQTLAYDPIGRVQSLTRQDGSYITFVWDMADRMSERQYRTSAQQPTDPPTDADTFTFDGANHMLTAVSGRYANTLTFGYDQAGRLVSEALTVAGQTYTVGRSYDAASRVVSLTYPDGSVVAQTFTPRRLLQKVSYQDAAVASFTYDVGGRRSTRTLGDGPGTMTTWGYVAGGNLLASISTPNLPSFTYTWDTNKNKTAEAATGVLQPYGYSTGAAGYDNADRLVAWNRADDNKNDSWTLTNVGDWQQFVENGTTHVRTHNNVHELATSDGSQFTYDARGNMLTNGITGAVCQWEADDHLQQVTVGGATVSFTYDALWRRVSKTSNAQTSVYVCANQMGYIPRTGLEVAEYTAGAAPANPNRTFVFESLADQPIGMAASGVTSYYHQNGTRSTAAITDSAGALAECYAYSASGGTTIFAPDGVTVRTASALANPYMYTSRRFDVDSQLYYFRARYYDSGLGRFMSRDPVDYDYDDYNLYRYATNAPLTHYDPLGTFAEPDHMVSAQAPESWCPVSWDSVYNNFLPGAGQGERDCLAIPLADFVNYMQMQGCALSGPTIEQLNRGCIGMCSCMLNCGTGFGLIENNFPAAETMPPKKGQWCFCDTKDRNNGREKAEKLANQLVTKYPGLPRKCTVWAKQGHWGPAGNPPEDCQPRDVGPGGGGVYNYVTVVGGYCVYMDNANRDNNGNPQPQSVIICKSSSCVPKYEVTAWCVSCSKCPWMGEPGELPIR